MGHEAVIVEAGSLFPHKARQEAIGQVRGVGILAGEQLESVWIEMISPAAAVLAAVAGVGVQEQPAESHAAGDRLIQPM